MRGLNVDRVRLDHNVVVVGLDIATMIGELFEGLFFTEVASLFGLMLFILLVVALCAYRWELSALTFPIVTYLGFLYWARLPSQPYFAWHILIVFMLALFNVIYMGTKISERRGRG